MSLAIALICEGADDGRIVPVLVDRLVSDAVDWVAQQPNLLTWRGCDPDQPYSTWVSLKRLSIARNQPTVPKRFGAGLPLREDAPDALKALLLLDALPPEQRPTAVILQRDDDRTHAHRRDALEAARNHTDWQFSVVVGVATPSIEAWVLAGFVPNDREQATHAEVCRHLGFDPCQHSHRLSPHHDDDTKQPKAVRARLTGNDWQREHVCLSESWQLLGANGRDSGLMAFIAEVRQRLILAVDPSR